VTGWQQVAIIGILAAMIAAVFWAWAYDRRGYYASNPWQDDEEGTAGRDSNPQTPIPEPSAGTRLLAHTAPDSDTAPGRPSTQDNPRAVKAAGT
jgi:hypothetical protein